MEPPPSPLSVRSVEDGVRLLIVLVNDVALSTSTLFERGDVSARLSRRHLRMSMKAANASRQRKRTMAVTMRAMLVTLRDPSGPRSAGTRRVELNEDAGKRRADRVPAAHFHATGRGAPTGVFTDANA